MDLQRILNTPQRLPSEIPETPSPITSPSRASTQSATPRSSVYTTQDSLSMNDSFDSVTTFVTTTPPLLYERSEECTRDKRIQI
jgi:hypothetical protein